MAEEIVTTKDMIAGQINSMTQFTNQQIMLMDGFFKALVAALAITPPYVDDVKDIKYRQMNLSNTATKPGNPSTTITQLINEVHDPGDFKPEPITPPKSVDINDFDGKMEPIVPPTSVPAFTDGIPGAPTIENIKTPLEKTFTVPAPPTLASLTLPLPLTISILPFYGREPVMPQDTTLPDKFSWSEPSSYTSSLLDDLKNKLSTDMFSGGVGVDPEVQQRAFDQYKSQEALILHEGTEKLLNAWASKNFSLPNGTIVRALNRLNLEFDFKLLDKATEIYLKQLELAQNNTQFVVGEGVKLEAHLMDQHSAMAERSLKAAIASVELGVALYNAHIARTNLEIEYYKAQAAVYESIIRAELAKAEVYKAQIDGEAAKGKIELGKAEIYDAQIKGILALVEAYKAEMSAAQVKATVEKLKSEVYSSEIQAFAAKVGLKTAEYGAYKAAWEGETTKASTFQAEVNAYEAYVKGLSVTAETEGIRVKSELDIERFKLEEYLANVKVTEAEAQMAMERIKGLVEFYKAESMMYTADVEKALSEGKMSIEEARVIAGINEANAKLALQQATTDLQAFLQVAGIQVDAAKAGTSVLASLVAAAMQSIHSGMNISSGFVSGYQESKAETTSTSEATNISKSDIVSYGYSSETSSSPTPRTSAITE